jgi:hypothetical protein
MTPEHAHNLAVRYKNIWRGGPPVDELATHLAPHDYDAASTAISHLARQHDTPPTIHQLTTAIDGRTITVLPQPDNTGPVIDPADYWQRITQRANDGDPDAIAQLGNYRRITRRA